MNVGAMILIRLGLVAEILNAVTNIDNKLEDIQPEEPPETPATTATAKSSDGNEGSVTSEDPAMDASFMSESIYQKLPSPSPKSLKHKSTSTTPSTGLRSMIWLTTDRETLHADST